MKCRKCGTELEIYDIEVINGYWKRFYVYCFECDKEYTIVKKQKD